MVNQSAVEFYQKLKREEKIAAVVIGLVVVIGLIWALNGQVGVSKKAPVSQGTYVVVDSINKDPVPIEVGGDVKKTEVYKIPETILALPRAEWFTPARMQIIGATLGLTSKATVENIGEQVFWQEDEKTLVIDPQIGTITFSSAFNLYDINLPTTQPSAEQARQSLADFLEQTQLPSGHYMLDELEYEYYEYTPEVGVGPSVTGAGPLMKAIIPLKITGLRLFVPVENYVVIDGEGTIRMLSLLVPHVKQTDRQVTMISWNEAKQRIGRGEAGVISAPGGNWENFSVESSYPAYYLNLKDFYSLSKRRVFTPVYVFEGPQGRAVVVAQDQ